MSDTDSKKYLTDCCETAKYTMPDLSEGSMLYLSDEDLRKVRSAAKKKKDLSIFIYIIIALLSAMPFTAHFINSYNDYGTIFTLPPLQSFISTAAPIAVLVCLMKLGMPYILAAARGEMSVYRFTVTGKHDEYSSNFIAFAGTEVQTNVVAYDKAKVGGDIYCAIFNYKKRNYFCFLGNELPGGSYGG